MNLPQSEPGFLYNDHFQNSRRPAAPCHRIGGSSVRRTSTAADAYPVSYLDAGTYGYALSHAYAVPYLDTSTYSDSLSDEYAISHLDAGAHAYNHPGGCPPLDPAH